MSTSLPPKPPQNVALDRDLPTPIHAQLSDAMRERIRSGAWPVHHRLTAEPALAVELGVSRGTLRRALATLIEEGLLKQVRGRGTFVTAPVAEPQIATRLRSLTEEFADQGIAWRTELLAAGPDELPGLARVFLDIAAPAPTFRLVRIGHTDDGPAAYLVTHVLVDVAPDLATIDFTTTSLFGALEQDLGLRIGSGRRTFSAVAAPQPVAEALGLAAMSPVQYLQQVTYLSDGRAVEYSDVWLDSSRLRITAHLTR